MKQFFLVDTTDRIHEVREDTSLTIGRAPENSIVLDDRLVSREHARITSSDKGPIITDRKSANGVTVNGRRIEAQILKHGDTIQIGKFLLFVFEGTRADVEAWTKRRVQSQTDQTIDGLSAAPPQLNDVVGDLSTLELVPLLRNLLDQRKRGCLELTQYGLTAGRIYLENGLILHAETPKPSEGTSALAELMGLEYGQFVFRAGIAAPRISITGNMTAAIQEACRLLDQRRNAPPAGAAQEPHRQ